MDDLLGLRVMAKSSVSRTRCAGASATTLRAQAGSGRSLGHERTTIMFGVWLVLAHGAALLHELHHDERERAKTGDKPDDECRDLEPGNPRVRVDRDRGCDRDPRADSAGGRGLFRAQLFHGVIHGLTSRNSRSIDHHAYCPPVAVVPAALPGK